MKIQDIYIAPSNESVVAHLQERLREAWIKSPTYPNQEVKDVLAAIRTCLKADGWPELNWCGSCQAWHEAEKHVVAPATSVSFSAWCGPLA